MNKNLDLYVNAVLADATYAKDLIDGIRGSALQQVLEKGVTPTLAKYIADNFSVVAHKESDDGILSSGSGFDATVWRGIEGGAFAGKVYVSMQGTLGAQDFLTDANLALPFGAGQQQIVDMVNWWNQITTPTDGQAAQIKQALVPFANGAGQFFAPAQSVSGTALLVGASHVEVNGHSLGGHLASAFARLYGNSLAIDAVTTFNSAGFSPGSEAVFTELENVLGTGATTFKNSVQTNVFANNGLNVTTNSFYFNQIGSRVGVFNESSGAQIPNHYMYKLTDSLAMFNVLQKLDPSLTIDKMNGLAEASSTQMKASLERAPGVRVKLFFTENTLPLNLVR